jgi:hypothetical protein
MGHWQTSSVHAHSPFSSQMQWLHEFDHVFPGVQPLLGTALELERSLDVVASADDEFSSVGSFEVSVTTVDSLASEDLSDSLMSSSSSASAGGNFDSKAHPMTVQLRQAAMRPRRSGAIIGPV